MLICGGNYAVNASVVITITTDKGDTLTKNITGTTGDGNQTVWIASKLVTTGSQIITLTFTGANATSVIAWCSEFNNVTAVDNCEVGTNSSTAPQPSTNVSFAQSGDLIVQVAEGDSTGNVTSWAAGSQANITWALAQNDIGYGTGTGLANQAVQWGVYTTTTAFEPQMAMAPTGSWNTAACSFKAGSAGLPAPTTPYVTSMEHYNIACPSNCASGFKIGAPLTGVAAVLGCIDSPNNGDLASISATNGETWIKIGENINDAGGGIVMLWYAKNHSFAASDVLTMTTGIPAGSSISTWTAADCVLYGLSGVDPVAPLDTGIAGGTAGGMTMTCTTGSCLANVNDGSSGNFVGGNVTPSTASGVIIAETGIANPQCTGVTGGGFLSDTAYSFLEATTFEMDENNCKTHAYYSSSSATTLTWTWVESSAGAFNFPGNWATVMAAFKAPASGPGGAGFGGKSGVGGKAGVGF
jgi:hypothetical protein